MSWRLDRKWLAIWIALRSLLVINVTVVTFECTLKCLLLPMPLSFICNTAADLPGQPNVKHIRVVQLWDDQGLNDFMKSLIVEEKVELVYKFNPCKDLPGHSCHLLFNQELWVRRAPKWCTSFEWGSITSSKINNGNIPTTGELNRHKLLVLSDLS